MPQIASSAALARGPEEAFPFRSHLLPSRAVSQSGRVSLKEMAGDEALAIRAENLAKTYRSGTTAITVFRGLSFEVRKGESVALVGESGAGKSTLLQLLGCLDRPSEGSIYFGSKGIANLTDAELSEFRNRMIGFVWQSHSLLPEFTALENVMMPLLIRGVPRRQAEPPAREKLEETGLRDRMSNRAGELSGGEQQRVALARALVAGPAVLLADEPTGSLDYRTGEGIVQLLENLHRSHQLTSVVVTHNLAFARRCDRVLTLEKGTLAAVADNAARNQESDRLIGADGNTYV